MISSGNATVMVADMNRAVDFYTKTLGLKLRVRFGDEWAEVETSGLIIGLHPMRPGAKPGTPGNVSLGFAVTELITTARAGLEAKGVKFFGPIIDNPPIKLTNFGDPDGSPLYLVEQRH